MECYHQMTHYFVSVICDRFGSRHCWGQNVFSNSIQDSRVANSLQSFMMSIGNKNWSWTSDMAEIMMQNRWVVQRFCYNAYPLKPRHRKAVPSGKLLQVYRGWELGAVYPIGGWSSECFWTIEKRAFQFWYLLIYGHLFGILPIEQNTAVQYPKFSWSPHFYMRCCHWQYNLFWISVEVDPLTPKRTWKHDCLLWSALSFVTLSHLELRKTLHEFRAVRNPGGWHERSGAPHEEVTKTKVPEFNWLGKIGCTGVCEGRAETFTFLVCETFQKLQRKTNGSFKAAFRTDLIAAGWVDTKLSGFEVKSESWHVMTCGDILTYFVDSLLA